MTELPELPPIGKVMNINEMYVDATPNGYALRLLRAYRRRCDEKWIVSGFEENERRVYDKMNEDQDKRAQELDRAILILEGTQV
jgi:hypothetical protein